MRLRSNLTAAVAVAALLGAAACSSSTASPEARGCGRDGIGPNQLLTVWSAYSGNHADTLDRLSARAEEQLDVEIVVKHFEAGELVRRLLQVEVAADLPDVVHVPDFALGAVLDASALDPVQTCLDELGTSSGDFLPEALEASQLSGVQWGLPLGWNGLLLVYDRNDLAAAGLPTDAPTTLAGLTSLAEAIRDTGGPPTPIVGRLVLFDLLGAAGVSTVDRADGHAGPPTRTLVGEPDGVAVFEWADELVESGLFDLLDPNDPLAGVFAIAEGRATFTLVEARELWQIGQALRQGQAPDVDLAVAAVPGIDEPGLLAHGEHLYLGRTLDPRRNNAAWVYLSFLTDAAGQAAWHSGADPFPARRSSSEDPTVTDLWETVPLLAQAWNVIIATSDAGNSHARPLIGPTITFNTALGQLEEALAPGGDPTVAEMMPAVVDAADEALSVYTADRAAYRRCALIEPIPACP